MSKATAAQRRRMDKVAAGCCIACRQDGIVDTPGEIHHCRQHGYRDHWRVICLCPAHHKMTSSVPGIPNRHGTPEVFEEKYGSDGELHLMTCAMLGEL